MESICKPVGSITFPPFGNTRVMMMPIEIGEPLPPALDRWAAALQGLTALVPEHRGRVGYLTIDEKTVQVGETHRRPGLHVDGVFRGQAGAWGGGGAPWASQANGMLLVASEPGCVAYNQRFEGEPGPEGQCDHLRSECARSTRIMLRPEVAYWMNASCVHESLPQRSPVRRQLIRLSLPSQAPWFEGYTESPLGVRPTGPILPRRDAFMDWDLQKSL